MPQELEVSFDDDPPSSAEESFESAKPVQRRAPEPAPAAAAAPALTLLPQRVLPHSLEAEEALIACALIDADDTLRKADEARVAPDSFYDSKHGLLWKRMLEMRAGNVPIDPSTLGEALIQHGELEEVGGYAFITQVSSRQPTTAQVQFYIKRVQGTAALRLAIRSAMEIAERGFTAAGDVDEFLDHSAKTFTSLADHSVLKQHAGARGILDFEMVPKNDPSVVIGRRYLNRGDIGILVSSSGMGKSSMAIQMAILWALGRDAFGVECNGRMRSLIIQSEDSDGDIAEVAASVCHKLELTDAERALVNRNVLLITDRVNRGPKFIASLRRQIAKFKPDIVWINPLQAFMEGDIKESQDLGTFVREGLNSLNEPATHVYMLVHHTNKIGGGSVKDKAAPNWFDMMYGMAGGAELINAARAIMILEPQKAEGEFTLNLAKRGKRAGVRRLVGESQNTWETVTKIPLKHAAGTLEGPDGKMPVIYWEPRVEEVPDEDDLPKKRGGGHVKYDFNDYSHLMPLPDSPGLPVRQLGKALMGEDDIKIPTLTEALKRWLKEGHVEKLPKQRNVPTHWRMAKLPGA